MKITIDTQVDTYDDIKKVLHILTNIIEQKGSSGSGSYSQPTSAAGITDSDTTNLMSMFSDASGTPTQKEVPDTPPDFSAFLNLTKSQSRKQSEPLTKVEFF